MPITKGKRRQLTTEERVRVIEMAARNERWSDIAKDVKIAESTARKIYKEWKTSCKLAPNHRPGRPKKLSERSIRLVVRLFDQNPQATLADITSMANLGVSVHTIARRLREEFRFVRYARKKPYLTPERKKKRLQWARTELVTSIRQWQTRIFTDEIHIELSTRGTLPLRYHT